MQFYVKLLILFALFSGFWYYWYNQSSVLPSVYGTNALYAPIIAFGIFLILEFALSFI